MRIYQNKGLSAQNIRFLRSLGLKVKNFSLYKNGNRFSGRYREIPIRR